MGVEERGYQSCLQSFQKSSSLHAVRLRSLTLPHEALQSQADKILVQI